MNLLYIPPPPPMHAVCCTLLSAHAFQMPMLSLCLVLALRCHARFTSLDLGLIHVFSLRPRGAPYSPTRPHNRHIRRRLAPSSAPTAVVFPLIKIRLSVIHVFRYRIPGDGVVAVCDYNADVCDGTASYTCLGF